MMPESATKSLTRVAGRESLSQEKAPYDDLPDASNAPGVARSPTGRAPSSRSRRASDASEDERLILSDVEERLRAASRENATLKSRNRQLARALADASQRGTAAHHLAHHDALTGLPNRLLLTTRLRDSISTASIGKNQIALLFIDLNNFKYVNDRLGHTVGDKLLTIVAARILASVRADDIACRYGGDEFVVLMSKIRDSAMVGSIAEKIRERIDGCYGIDDNEVHISASVGFAVYPTHGEHCDALLKYADDSMYRSKAARHGGSGEADTSAPEQGHSIRDSERAVAEPPPGDAEYPPPQPSFASARPRRRAEKC
jgi:diguanylate cyclase